MPERAFSLQGVFMDFISVVVQERRKHVVKDEDTCTEEKKVQAKTLVV